MRHLYQLTLAAAAMAASGASAWGQIITSEPVIVQRSTAPIVLTYHANEGNRGLAGLDASTPIYAHTGVIPVGGADGDWKHAPSWGDNSAKYELTYAGPDTWTLTIPSIDSYYGTAPDESVGRLAFVFRTADGKKEGKTESGGDIFVAVAPDGFAIDLQSDPAEGLITQEGPVALKLYATSEADLFLYANSTTNAPFASAEGSKQLVASYDITESGATDIIAVARCGGQTATTSLSFFLAGQPQAQAYPGGGEPVMGPVTNPDGSVTFCIAAPGKESVMLQGSWNDYAFSVDQLMKYTHYQGQRYFWCTVPNLADGQDYIYFFTIDSKTQVGDPYARLVVDPWNDKWISSDVFPNMPQYPSSVVTKTPVAIYNSTMDDYDWQVTDFKGAAQDDLIIYELLIRDFTGREGGSAGSGNIAGLMSKLDYLQRLGVNAIELLPIMEFNGNNSWGYNTNFYFAPDKAYGTPNDYRALIDAIHQRGMAVILDIVFNQSDGLHPWYMMYPIAENPFYNGTAPHAYSVLNDWNQDNPLVQRQFKDALKFWLKEYKVDGFRFDLVKGLGSNQSYNATYDAANNTWSNVTDAKTNAYNASRVARMRELHDAMREVNPDAYFINENLAGAKEENEMAQDGETNWANINYASCEYAMGYVSKGGLNRFYAPDDSRTWGSTVSYAESHDEERMAYKCAKYGAAGVKDNLAMTTRRLGSVAAQMLMTPGAHMIWQFQEMGADQTTKDANGGNNTSPKKVIWSYLDNPDRAGLHDSYQQLCRLRRDNPEIFAKDVATTVSLNDQNQRYVTLRKGDKALFLAVNPKLDGDATVTVPGVDASTAWELYSASYGVTPQLNAANGTVTLPAGAYAVYGTTNLTALDTPVVDDNAPVSYFTLQGVALSGQPDVPGIYIRSQGGKATKMLVR